MVRVTDDKEVKETVLAGLRRNKEKYGMCHCQLYVKTKDESIQG